MSNGIPKPPPGFETIAPPAGPPAPPPGFEIVSPEAGDTDRPQAPSGPGPEQAQRPAFRVVDDIVRSVAEGVTLGFADEISAALDTITGRAPSFDEALQRQRRRTEEIPAGERLAANIAGGMLTGPAMGLRAPATLGQAARQGAGLGALAGAGFAEGGIPERATGAAVGAAIGGPLAAGGQALIGTVGRAIARARQGVTGPTAAAMDDILREMRAGGITPDEAVARVRRLGPEGMLADIPELQRIAQQTAARTATGQRVAQSAIESRAAGAANRIDDALEGAFGPQSVREFRAGLVSSRQQDAAPLYQQALKAGTLETTDALKEALETPQVASALKRTMQSPKFKGLPQTDIRVLDRVYKVVGERAKRPGAAQSLVKDAREALKDAIGDQVPAYREAVDTFSTRSRMIDAFDLGAKALNELPEVVASNLQSLPGGERAAYVAGLARAATRAAAGGATGSQSVRSLLRGERSMVLREALGPENFGAFRGRLLREIEFAKTGGRVLAQSPTQPRQAAAQEAARNLGRLERAGRAIRGQGSVIGAAAELATPRGTPNIARERALAQLLFRSQGQGLPARFMSETPLLELAARQRLLSGSAAMTRPATTAAPGAAGTAGGRGSSDLLDLAGF